MQNTLLIKNQEKFEKTKAAFKAAGKDTIHVVADFDHTLTAWAGQISVIAQLREGNYLTPEYAPKAFALFDIYGKLDHDYSLTLEERIAKMHEWWTVHFDLMIECGLDKSVLEHAVENRPLVYRDGVLEWIDMLHEHKIPLVILSAGLGDMIDLYLKKEGRLYDTVHVVSNRFQFNEEGKVVGIVEPMIHSLNKGEIALHGQPFYQTLLERKHIFLLGDNMGDIDMTAGFPYDEQIAIGFLNHDVEERKARYGDAFDIVITDDGGIQEITTLFQEIVKA